MSLLEFKSSSNYSLGIELELQIINPRTYNLFNRSKDLIREAQSSSLKIRITPEVTQSMLEVNSSVHLSPQGLYQELREIHNYLSQKADKFNILICGGGTHPFQKWYLRKIFPKPRYRELLRKYKYLAKQATVFGLHIHVGCDDPQKALYLTHILLRYTPQLMAMGASSPFNEGVDTGYDSSRLMLFKNFPTSGIIPPYLQDWQSFTEYFYKMKKLGIAESMKDYYWDVRPKPEFGTVEIRVCDMPLTLKQTILITAYAQSLACYILEEKPLPVSYVIPTFYNYNRFQAARYGLKAKVITSEEQKIPLIDDILATIDIIKPAAKSLGNEELINELQDRILKMGNEASLLREVFNETGSLQKVVEQQCLIWREDS